MKKLSLNKLKLDADDLLQREQLKTVFGGYGGFNGGGDCNSNCSNTNPCKENQRCTRFKCTPVDSNGNEVGNQTHVNRCV